jgi:gas vesicle protein
MNHNPLRAFSCFLVGVATGAAVTLLFAPQSGGTTRRLISRTVKDGERWTKDKVASAKDHVFARDEEIRDGVKQAAAAIG